MGPSVQALGVTPVGHMIKKFKDRFFIFWGQAQTGLSSSLAVRLEVVLALSIYPGVVAFGTGIRWEVGPRLNARGSHALSVELLYNFSHLARIRFHSTCAGVCECLGLRGNSALATKNLP
eukprot:1141185-Pelagomonas_calceolata.AAC.1